MHLETYASSSYDGSQNVTDLENINLASLRPRDTTASVPGAWCKNSDEEDNNILKLQQHTNKMIMITHQTKAYATFSIIFASKLHMYLSLMTLIKEQPGGGDGPWDMLKVELIHL
jgi:hypothetical protein